MHLPPRSQVGPSWSKSRRNLYHSFLLSARDSLSIVESLAPQNQIPRQARSNLSGLISKISSRTSRSVFPNGPNYLPNSWVPHQPYIQRPSASQLLSTFPGLYLNTVLPSRKFHTQFPSNIQTRPPNWLSLITCGCVQLNIQSK